MLLVLNPILEALQAARKAAADSITAGDEMTVDDCGDHWIFEFIPQGDTLVGGARVSVAKDGLQVLSVVRGQ